MLLTLSRTFLINFIAIIIKGCQHIKMNEKKLRNPKNVFGVSFGTQVELHQKAKIRMQELGIESFSEYVKQLIKYDLGLPNYIGEYIAKSQEQRKREEALETVLVSKSKSKGKKNAVA